MRGLSFFFISILTQVCSSTVSVTGFIGHNVTLPCKYDVQTHGALGFCWGRATVPTFKCSETILSSEDGVIQIGQSSRYELLGETAGDVSLTILNAQWSDAGVYGCRVEVPGWFNDYKVNTHLVMEEAPLEPLVTQVWTVSTEISTSETLTEADQKSTIIERITSEEKFKGFQEVGNISRIGAIFLTTLIIILFLVFWRRFKSWRTLRRLSTSAAENIYESPSVPE